MSRSPPRASYKSYHNYLSGFSTFFIILGLSCDFRRSYFYNLVLDSTRMGTNLRYISVPFHERTMGVQLGYVIESCATLAQTR